MGGDRNPRNSATICLGTGQSSQSIRFTLSRLPHRLLDRLAKSNCTSKRRHAIRGQAHPHRWPAARHRSDGSITWATSVDKGYETVRIRIAFHPIEEKFEVANPAIQRDAAWIDDIANLFAPDAKLLQITKSYASANKGVDEDVLFSTFERLRKIINNHFGVIELAEDLDIETVTEIFIRVNSAGATLSQADFAMSKIAANSTYGGSALRKAIDYFCHLAVAPEFANIVEKNDPAFAASEYWPKLKWLKDANDDLYDPSYTDMLRVAFTSQFRRGRLQDLVALLSGRNFETKQYEEVIAEQSFSALKSGVIEFVNKTHFDPITMILRSAGLVVNDLIGGQNAVNFAYILYLQGRTENLPAADIERLVRRWYAMSILRGRYAGSPETAFDVDIRQIASQGLFKYAEAVIASEIPERSGPECCRN